MAVKHAFSSLACSFLLFNAASATLDPIIKVGSKFFYKTNGTQFYIRGVAYQQDTGAAGTSSSNATYVDPLADSTSCTRDVPLLKALGTNVIRTYAIDPTQDHSTCMKLLDAAGIYVISDLSEPSTSINRADPAWDTDLYTRYTSVIDELAQYDNVIGFFAGNEVSNNASNTDASAFVKAAVRDSKSYIAAKYPSRWMGVGYAANDDADIRDNMANYFNCGNSSDSIDFWGYNMYEWCGDSTFETSGYQNITEFFSGYSVPWFFAEYGCNTGDGKTIASGAANRPFTEVQSIYGPDMDGEMSGGIVYEYFQEANDYGLVSVDSSGSASTLADYNSLSSQLAKATPTSVHSSTYSATATARACPSVNADWQSSSTLPPTPNEALCSCIYSSLTCVVSSSTDATDYGTLFGEVCGYNSGKPCTTIAKNATTGVYGAYSMCNSTVMLSVAFDAYYQEQGKSSSACSFSGAANIVKAAGVASSCSAAIASVSSAAAASSTKTSSTSSSSSSSTSKSAAGGFQAINMFSTREYAVGAYMIGAMVLGAGMIVL